MLSPSKSIKGSNYGEFLKDKNVLLCTRLYKYAPNLKTKTEVETKEKKINTKKTSVLHGHSISNGRKVGTGWYLISAVVSLSPLFVILTAIG
jgi:hypothetical protein